MKELSFQAKAYITCMLLAGVSILVWYLPDFQDQNIALVLALGVLAGLTQFLKVEGAPAKSSYNISLFIYAFTFFLLGHSSAILVIIIAHLIEWIGFKDPWFMQFYNITSYVIVMTAAALVNNWVSLLLPSHDTTITLGLVVSMLVFVFLNHMSIGVVVFLVKDESLTRSSEFNKLPMMVDLTLLYLGVLAAFVWQVNAYAVILTTAPLVLFYIVLKIPMLKMKTRLDPKTGLYNSRYFEEALDKEVARAGRFNRPLTVAMADMDFMRKINNTYGHLAGDEVLLSVAAILKNSFREYDVVARFGGEEFAILLPEVSIQEAYYHFESLCREIENHAFHISTSVSPVQTTISFGLSELESPDQPTKEIIHNADLALYNAKMSGRNTVSLYLENGVKELFTSSVTAPLIMDHINLQEITMDNGKPQVEFPTQSEVSTSKNPTPRSTGIIGLKPRKRNYVDFYIGVVAITSILFLGIISDFSLRPDLLGISLFAAFVLLTEWFSVEIYVKRIPVSTSVMPFIAGVLLFGPFAATIYAFLIAGVAITKHRSHVSRFVFNFSNHMIGGLIIAALMKLLGGSYQDLAVPSQLGISLIAGGIVYVSSTWLIAVEIYLDKGQLFWKVWNERYRSLAPSYLLMGVMVYFLTFSYLASGLIGIFVVAGPLLLLRYSQMQFVKRTETIAKEFRTKKEEITHQSIEHDEINESLLFTLAKVIEYRDPYVYGHSEYVAKYASRIAEELDMPESKVEAIHKAALLHDIGKLGVPDSVLLKPGILTAEEYEDVKQHSLIGAELLETCPSLHEIIPWVLHHHERFDGRGYPGQLRGNEIPIEARILAFADTVDAMASDRPYRIALEPTLILDELRRNEKLQFDPKVMEAFFRLLQREGISFIRNSASEIPTSNSIIQRAEART